MGIIENKLQVKKLLQNDNFYRHTFYDNLREELSKKYSSYENPNYLMIICILLVLIISF